MLSFLRTVVSFLLIIYFNATYAQCDLACGSTVQISFDADIEECQTELEFTTALKSMNEFCNEEEIEVHILDESGKIVLNTDGIILYEWVGRKLQFKILETEENNSCWGYLNIEDKKGPVLECDNQEPIEVFCYESIDAIIEEYYESEDCSPVEYRETNTLRRVNRCDGSFPDETFEEVVKTIVAFDQFGNPSNECNLTFIIRRILDLEDIVIPPSFTEDKENALSCIESIPEDEKGQGFPSPIMKNGIMGTGVPTIEGIPLYPNNGLICNLWVDYEDQKTKDGCKRVLIRNWTITEGSCSGAGEARSISMPQRIEIIDDQAPIIEFLPDMTVSTGTHHCGRYLRLVPPEVREICDNGYKLDVKWTGDRPGFIGDYDKSDALDLAPGENEVVFIAYDECGNTSRDTLKVLVEDLTPPVTVCKTYTVASLTNEGIAKVHASSFDNGSKDECELKKILVKRMDNGLPCGTEENDAQFDEFVSFCCEDIGKSIMVLVQSTDKAGNSSECMVEVEVQDKLDPLIICPPDISVYCGIPTEDLNIFGRVVDNPADAEEFSLPDEYFIGPDGPLVDGVAIDNCEVDVSEKTVFNLNNCGIGTIERTFIAEDGVGRRDSCTQVITFFRKEYSEQELILDWPNDTTLYGCMTPDAEELSPENVGEPILNYDDCRMLGKNSVDEIYATGGQSRGLCFKIFRRWRVIDWCAVESSSRKSEWNHLQVIKILDSIPPVIIGEYPAVDTCSFDLDCLNGVIDLQAVAKDTQCLLPLTGYFEIDANSDGDINITSDKSLGDTIDASGTYPQGTHIIYYHFIDHCGNKATVSQVFSINNCKAPTPYAYNGLVVDIMGVDENNDQQIDGGMIEIWASDFDAGSTHPCDLPVILSFSADTTDKSRVFTCDSLGKNEVTLWATIVGTNGDLIQNFTTTTIDVQDNLDICDEVDRVGTFTVDLIGEITSVNNKRMVDVQVDLEGSGIEVLTSASGAYAFPSMPTGGTYIISPHKNNDPTNGVNTLDLVKIQRHILGISPFQRNYQWIAADINNDKSLSAADLIELRKLILGINKQFKTNESWKFVDQTFDLDGTPYILDHGIPTSYFIQNLDRDMVVDFTGIKIGDVDNDHSLNARSTLQSRSRENIFLVYDVRNDFINDELVYSFTSQSEDISELIGVDMVIEVPEKLSFKSALGGVWTMSDDQYFYDDQSGELRISLNYPYGEKINGDQPLFQLIFKAIPTGITLNPLNVSSGVIYLDETEVMDIAFLQMEDESKPLSVSQNFPNPFQDDTQIIVTAMEESSGTFTILNVSGQIILNRALMLYPGKNFIEVDHSEIPGPGVYYYRIANGKDQVIKKMISMR